MKVLVLGSGGREHALAWKIAASPLVKRVFCAPGNAGTQAFCATPALDLRDHRAVYQFAKQEALDLVVVGPEQPLCDGLVDRLEQGGIRTFGPTRRAARLEGSKAFAKSLMRRHSIPTAEFKVFTRASDANDYLGELAANDYLPVVVKADGLCSGKGVVVAHTLTEARQAVHAMMVERRFGDAGAQVVIEECLTGREVSVLALAGGSALCVLEEACDAKRLRDGDEGPNTGGMGAYSPSGVLDRATRAEIEERILVGTLHAMKREDSPFRGVLYAGLMLTPVGPRVLEFNARFGDPETQALLPRLRSDIVPLLLGTVDDTIADQTVEWDPRPSVTVVMASAGYPEDPRVGAPISGLRDAAMQPDVWVFHAGTRIDPQRGLVTSGGRVLAVTALGATFAEARERAYKAVRAIRYDGAVYRTDIAAGVA